MLGSLCSPKLALRYRGAGTNLHCSARVPRPRSSAEQRSSDASRDGSEQLLSILGAGPAAYVDFCKSYYGIDVPEDDVAKVYRHGDLDVDLLQRLGGKAEPRQLQADLEEIGYPGLLRT